MNFASETQNGEEYSQDGERAKKARCDYVVWSEQENRELLRLLVEEVKNGNKMDNGNFKKYTITQNVLPFMNAKFGRTFKFDHVKNKIKSWKRKIEPIELLLRNNSGFGWDPISQRITCSVEVWENYKQAHPNTPMLKDKLFENFEDMQMVVGSHSASGRAAGGLGCEGVESAPLHNALGEGILDDDIGLDAMGEAEPTQPPVDPPPPPPYSTPGPTTPVAESVPSTSSTSRNVRRAPPRTTTSALSQPAVQEMASGITIISKALQELVTEVRLLRSRNQPWVEGVASIPEFTDEERLTVLSQNISQDVKDMFVKMNDDQRRRFMIWRLTGVFPNDDNYAY
ncbi:uncharacterized protein At2g29880-like [Asparagus officinalis]|uniref:uncharacterized protein At2g29880-like n=1 Tax=Asparagus officinalis TaxID=4686 RepID=UPI00098E0822|nr:uncharacterized protein At2g29880-like [Asparagus officinalis]